MTYFGKQLTTQDYQKCFDILNSGKLNNTETYKQFLVSVFEVAKVQMGCEDCGLEFGRYEKDNYGRAAEAENVIKINLLNAKPRYICQNISTIYHELVHMCQYKEKGKKQLGFAKSPTLPFEQSIHPYILNKDLLGVHPFLVYYCSNIEKQARDIGYYEAGRFFENMDKLSTSKKTRSKVQKVIQKSKKYFEKKYEYEQLHYKIAYDAIAEFVNNNPDFVSKALDNVFAEFRVEAHKVGAYSFDRINLEELAVSRINALVNLGCNDECKNKIIEFLTTEVLFKKYIVLGLLYVVDSPYSKITMQDFEIVFECAIDSGDFDKSFADCFQNWKKQDILLYMKQYIEKEKSKEKTELSKECAKFEDVRVCKNSEEQCQIY